MRTKIKTMLLMLTLLVAVLWLTECKKSNPSILGKWICSTYRVLETSNGITTLDSTYILNSTNDTLVFYANGYHAASYPTPGYGIYKFVANTIELYDTSIIWARVDTIVSLTDNSLLLASPTFRAINSDSITTTQRYFYGYSR